MKNKLKGIIMYHDDTAKELAKALNLSQTSLSYKINGKVEFTRREMMIIKERYNLSAEEIDDIFFDNIVSQ